jgi:hypothetical protein
MEYADGSDLAINLTRLLPEIIRYCLFEGDASHSALDEMLMNARFRAYQIVQLQEFASTELDIILSGKVIASAFNVSHSTVTRAMLRCYEDPPGRGRHHEFSPDYEAEIVD